MNQEIRFGHFELHYVFNVHYEEGVTFPTQVPHSGEQMSFEDASANMNLNFQRKLGRDFIELSA